MCMPNTGNRPVKHPSKFNKMFQKMRSYTSMCLIFYKRGGWYELQNGIEAAYMTENV